MTEPELREKLHRLEAGVRQAALLEAESRVLTHARYGQSWAELRLIQAIADDIHLLTIGGES